MAFESVSISVNSLSIYSCDMRILRPRTWKTLVGYHTSWSKKLPNIVLHFYCCKLLRPTSLWHFPDYSVLVGRSWLNSHHSWHATQYQFDSLYLYDTLNKHNVNPA